MQETKSNKNWFTIIGLVLGLLYILLSILFAEFTSFCSNNLYCINKLPSLYQFHLHSVSYVVRSEFWFILYAILSSIFSLIGLITSLVKSKRSYFAIAVLILNIFVLLFTIFVYGLGHGQMNGY